jgi:hypothetical protein
VTRQRRRHGLPPFAARALPRWRPRRGIEALRPQHVRRASRTSPAQRPRQLPPPHSARPCLIEKVPVPTRR